MREILEEELPGREHLDVERGAAGDLRARALLDHGRERRARRRWSAATSAGSADRLSERRLRRRPAAAPFRRRRDDTRRPPSGWPCGWPRRGSPPARSRAATSRRCAASRTRSGSTWAARSTDISLVYGGEERVDEGVVRRVRLPDRVPLDRGADDRRRRRLVRLDRRGRARCGTGRSRRARIPGPACYGRGNDRPTNTDANVVLGRLGARADRRRDDARPRRRRARRSREHVGRAARARRRRGGRRDHQGREREHGRRRAADLDPPRLRPARVRARRLRRRGTAARRRARAGARRSRPCSCRRTPGSRPRSAACSSTSGTTSSTMFLGQRRRRRSGRSSRPSSRSSSAKARERLAGRGRAGGADEHPAADRHALPRPVALADDPVDAARRPRRPRSRGSTRSTSASTTTAATARRSRSTG